MKWMPREHPKIDRIACPWLISSYIDQDPEFLFVVPERVLIEAKLTGAVGCETNSAHLRHSGATQGAEPRIAIHIDGPPTGQDILRT